MDELQKFYIHVLQKEYPKTFTMDFSNLTEEQRKDIKNTIAFQSYKLGLRFHKIRDEIKHIYFKRIKKA